MSSNTNTTNTASTLHASIGIPLEAAPSHQEIFFICDKYKFQLLQLLHKSKHTQIFRALAFPSLQGSNVTTNVNEQQEQQQQEQQQKQQKPQDSSTMTAIPSPPPSMLPPPTSPPADETLTFDTYTMTTMEIREALVPVILKTHCTAKCSNSTLARLQHEYMIGQILHAQQQPQQQQQDSGASTTTTSSLTASNNQLIQQQQQQNSSYCIKYLHLAHNEQTHVAALIMEDIGGEDLSRVMTTMATSSTSPFAIKPMGFDVSTFLDIAIKVTRGLLHVHRCKIVHRVCI